MKWRVGLAIWLVLVVVAAAAVGVGWLRHRHTAQQQRAGSQALATARSTITTLLTYQGKDLTQEVTKEQRLLTPSYAGTYRDMVMRDVAPTAESAGASVAASVVAAGVVRASTQSVVALLFVNLTTHTTANPDPVTQGSRLRVTLHHSGERWLVSDVEPL